MADENIKPSFTVIRFDQFETPGDDDSSAAVGSYETLDEALSVARSICAEGVKHCGSVERWIGMGDAGCVYDSERVLVWDGPTEYPRELDKGV